MNAGPSRAIGFSLLALLAIASGISVAIWRTDRDKPRDPAEASLREAEIRSLAQLQVARVGLDGVDESEEPADQTPAGIRVKIVDSATSDPLSGVSIFEASTWTELLSTESAAQSSDQEGLAVLAADCQWFGVTQEEYTPRLLSLRELREGASAPSESVLVVPMDPEDSIEVYVLDVEGHPVPGAIVALSLPGTALPQGRSTLPPFVQSSGTTGADGRAQVPRVHGGRLLEASCTGYATARSSLDDEVSSCTLTLGRILVGGILFSEPVGTLGAGHLVLGTDAQDVHGLGPCRLKYSRLLELRRSLEHRLDRNPGEVSFAFHETKKALHEVPVEYRFVDGAGDVQAEGRFQLVDANALHGSHLATISTPRAALGEVEVRFESIPRTEWGLYAANGQFASYDKGTVLEEEGGTTFGFTLPVGEYVLRNLRAPTNPREFEPVLVTVEEGRTKRILIQGDDLSPPAEVLLDIVDSRGIPQQEGKVMFFAASEEPTTRMVRGKGASFDPLSSEPYLLRPGKYVIIAYVTGQPACDPVSLELAAGESVTVPLLVPSRERP